MAQKFANAARAYLSAGISDVATTVTITAGGALFPEITGSDFSRAVLQDEAGIEIVLITAHTAASNSFTVTRGQEGTTARAFSAGAVFGLRMTAADGDTFAGMLPRAGGVMTGAITALKETRVAAPANDFDLSTANYFTKTISGVTSLTVSNVPASGTTASFILDLTNGGSAAITWWTGVKWAGGAPPALTSAGRDVLGFFTHDGGTTWTGLLLGLDVK